MIPEVYFRRNRRGVPIATAPYQTITQLHRWSKRSIAITQQNESNTGTMGDGFYELHQYTCPAWARGLKQAPPSYVKISSLNTPVHKWNLPNTNDFSVSIKRDDLTGAELSGSKVRSLQFLFADALTSQCRHVVTGGGIQSGLCRAVSLISRALGMVPHLAIEGAERIEDLKPKGNTLLYRLAGSHIYPVPYENYDSFKRRVVILADYIRSTYGEKCYTIQVGGLSAAGVFGFISAFEELLNQGLHENVDDIVVTIATGGAALGLALGNYLTGSKVKVHAVTIALSADCLHNDLDLLLTKLGLSDLNPRDILDIIEGYVGEKYGTATEEGLDFIAEVCSKTGILLDPYYTGKGAFGMVKEMETCPQRFKGKRILFFHTGGIFGLFNGEMERVIDKEVTNNIRQWTNVDQNPLL